MAAYVVGTLYNISDPAGFEEYRSQAGPTLEQYGGKLVLMSQKVEAGDGNWSPVGIVVIEFESMERAKQWYNSPEYSAVKPMRLQTTDSALIFADAG